MGAEVSLEHEVNKNKTAQPAINSIFFILFVLSDSILNKFRTKLVSMINENKTQG